jgi:hypothetical protein
MTLSQKKKKDKGMTRLLRHSGSICPTETAEAAARPTWGQGTTMGDKIVKSRVAMTK